MLDNLSAEQVAAILAESSTLRLIVANQLSNTLRNRVDACVRENGNNKIDAIKAIRAMATEHELHSLFPNLAWCGNSRADGVIGLADSKRLVEHVATLIGKPYPTYQ